VIFSLAGMAAILLVCFIALISIPGQPINNYTGSSLLGTLPKVRHLPEKVICMQKELSYRTGYAFTEGMFSLIEGAFSLSPQI